MALNIPCGGWCPRGRRAEDGRIPERYPLQETASPSYSSRTIQNVTDSDGTLILTFGRTTGGTLLTKNAAQRRQKPCLVVDLEETARRRGRSRLASNKDDSRSQRRRTPGRAKRRKPTARRRASSSGCCRWRDGQKKGASPK